MQEKIYNHSLKLDNRESLELTGIKNVDAFNEDEIIAVCDDEKLLIKGEALHIEVLDLTTGSLVVKGKITALIYNEQTQIKGYFKRLFS